MDKTQKLEFLLTANIAPFSQSIKSANGSLSGMAEKTKAFRTVFNLGARDATEGTKAIVKEADKLLAMLGRLEAKGKTSLANVTVKEAANVRAQAAFLVDTAKSAAPSKVATLDARKLAEEEKAARDYNSTLITMRYSLYDIANAGQAAGQVLSQFANASVTAAAAQESAFSQIQKTQVGTATTTAEMDKLKIALLEMSAAMPISFADLSKIGMLAAQLGIEAESIAKFTEVVAQFSAISGMSAEEAAMGFGKLANLLGLTDTQYQALGASIAKVGISSAATEQQIINTAGQVAAIGKAAGLTASEIIGLSSSMASLKIAPEEARGVLVQAFHAMDKAVASYSTGLGKGNESLNRFAEISDMSAKQFVDNWSDKKNGGAGQAWNAFINGMSKQGDVSRALRQLGLDGIRTSKGLTALALNAKDFNEQLKIAKDAGTKGTFLDEAYVTIADDLTSSLAQLKNAAENAMAAMSNNPVVMGFLKGIVDSVTFLLNGFRRLSEGPLGVLVNTLSAVAIGFAGLVGLLLTVAATGAIAAGSFLALRTAFETFKKESNGATLSLGTFLSVLTATPIPAAAAAASIDGVAIATGVLDGTQKKAIISAKALRIAMAGTGIGLILVLLGSIIAGFMEADAANEEVVTGLDEQQKASKAAADELSSLSSELSGYIDMALAADLANISMKDSLYSLGSAIKQNGNDFSSMSDSGRKNLTALGSTIKSITTNAAGDQRALANDLAALEVAMKEAGVGGLEAFMLIESAMQATGIAGSAHLGDVTAFLDGLKASSDGAASSVKTTLDYASELITVIKNAATIRFGKDSGIVAMGDAVAKMNKDAADATARVKELQATLAQKRGTRQQLQTRLNLASQYGATGLAERTQAELDALNSEVSAAETEMQYNIDKMSGSLNLNTQAGRDNFKAIQDLSGGYMDYINGVAQSSKSQTEVNKAVKDSKKGFEEQLIAMGFSKDKIKEMSAQFDGFSTLVKDTFSNITVDVNTTAAQQAIDAFLASNSNKSITIGLGVGNKPSASKPTTINYSKISGTHGYSPRTPKKITTMYDTGNTKVTGGSPYTVGNAKAMTQIATNLSTGGAFVVQLSPEDRALLANANRQIILKTDDRVIAKSANNGNMLLLRKANG